jgi:putative sterol carrier protein
MAPAKKAPALFAQLHKSLEKEGDELAAKVKGLIHFKIDDSEWTLDLRQGETPSLVDGPPKTEPDLRVTINDDNFANLVAGKLGQQKAFLLGKLKIKGSMGMAMKLSPIIEAAAPPPQSKL